MGAAAVRPDVALVRRADAAQILLSKMVVGIMGKGCLMKLKADDELPRNPHVFAKFIVKWPCCCCWMSLLISILLTVIGIVTIVRGTDPGSPTGPLKQGQNYPVYNPISRQMDALTLAMEDAGKTRLVMDATRRRLNGDLGRPQEVEKPGIVDELVLKLTGRYPEEFDAYRSKSPTPSAAHEGRGLSEASAGVAVEYQQEEFLTVALFVYRAKDPDGNCFDDDGLKSLCDLHYEMTSNAGFPDFCKRGLDESKGDAATPGVTCHEWQGGVTTAPNMSLGYVPCVRETRHTMCETGK